MKLTRLFLPRRQIFAYLCAILVGVLITAFAYGVLPSQASPVAETAEPEPLTATQRAPLPPTEGSFVAAAVNRVGAAVVRIDTEKIVTRRLDPMFDDPFFRRFFGDDFFSQMPQERERRLQGQGSGFIIDDSGIILTNAHVVNEADKVTVILKDGRTFEGKVQGADPVTDLAVIRINGTKLPTVPLGNSDTVQVGDWAIAVGNPLGLDNTVTLGIVSTLNRPSSQVGIPDKRLDFIQTDAAINPGNSGGPLLNQRGEVIGINTAIRADAMGIGFAIPVNKAKTIYPQLARGEKITHPYLGIRMTTLTPEIAEENNLDPNSALQLPEIRAVLVMGVIPDTPAAKSGIRRGDVITEIDGQRLTNAGQLQSLVENSGVGTVLRLKVQRGKETRVISVRTGELDNVS